MRPCREPGCTSGNAEGEEAEGAQFHADQKSDEPGGHRVLAANRPPLERGDHPEPHESGPDDPGDIEANRGEHSALAGGDVGGEPAVRGQVIPDEDERP
jgi:hypothetical protein